jgi:ribosome-binding protein aMBF1 (putative translation factor)
MIVSADVETIDIAKRLEAVDSCWTTLDGVWLAETAVQSLLYTASNLECSLEVGAPAYADDFADIDAEIDELERAPGGKERMASARAWASNAIYGDHPESLKALRMASGLSQAALAKQLGTDQAVISRWESGRGNLQTSSVKKLAEVLQVQTPVIWKIAEAMWDGESK